MQRCRARHCLSSFALWGDTPGAKGKADPSGFYPLPGACPVRVGLGADLPSGGRVAAKQGNIGAEKS
ncbi:hypothetical protein Ga0080559_TMP1072 [Salipiger profundus]|uniref:Uncharacterized protein n=1 Tax=Salipiger profundus TaxID=1229727 RepID=A0A1U7D182_9RHOB|nr:hypothetical protein Ga0080559_TMP1072 [Salipiger profundus]